jgi:signal peptide peptidase SppA
MQTAHSQAWAMLPEALEDYRRHLFECRAGRVPSARLTSGPPSPSGYGRNDGRVAVIPMLGLLLPRTSAWDEVFGATSMMAIGQKVTEAANDGGVKAILLYVDSPGGTVAGTPELAAQVAAAASRKPVAVLGVGLMASAAYWVGSQGSEVHAQLSTLTGSVGVIIGHTDLSQAEQMNGIRTTLITSSPFKGELDSSAPLTDAARGNLQNMVDQFGRMFVRDVAKGRRTTADKVDRTYGQGRVLTAADARAAGMIDSITTLGPLLQKLADGGSSGGARAYTGTPTPLALEARLRCEQIAREERSEIVRQIESDLRRN